MADRSIAARWRLVPTTESKALAASWSALKRGARGLAQAL